MNHFRQQQADRNKAKVLERLERRKKKGAKTTSMEEAPKMTQEECLTVLRKFVEKSPIPGIQKQTLHNITKVCRTIMSNILFRNFIVLSFHV